MKIKLPKLFVKPKNLLSKHINSLISHAFSSRRSPMGSSSRGKSRATGTYKSLSFKEFLENKDSSEDRKAKNLNNKGSRRIMGNSDAFIAKEGSKHSGRFSSGRTASGRRKSTQNSKVIMQNGGGGGGDEREHGSGEMELCKKRILMGEKCRPLNISGCLKYDETGILLPEEIFE